MLVFFRRSRHDDIGNQTIEQLLRSHGVSPVQSEDMEEWLAKRERGTQSERCMLLIYAWDGIELAGALLYVHDLRLDRVIGERDVVVLIVGEDVSKQHRGDMILQSLVYLLGIEVVVSLEMAVHRTLPFVLKDLSSG